MLRFVPICLSGLLEAQPAVPTGRQQTNQSQLPRCSRIHAETPSWNNGQGPHGRSARTHQLVKLQVLYSQGSSLPAFVTRIAQAKGLVLPGSDDGSRIGAGAQVAFS